MLAPLDGPGGPDADHQRLAARRARRRRCAEAGLQRVTVSLDSLDDAVVRAHERRRRSRSAGCSQGIEAARARRPRARSRSTWSCRRGLNEDSVLPMARYFRRRGHILRFIEYMDVGHYQRLAAGRRGAGRRDPGDASTPRCRSSPSARTTPARSPTAGGTATAAARWASSRRVTQPFCADLHAGPPVRRGPAVHVPLRRPRPRPAGPLRAGATDERSASASRGSGASAPTATRRSRSEATVPTCPRWRCPTSAAEPRYFVGRSMSRRTFRYWLLRARARPLCCSESAAARRTVDRRAPSDATGLRQTRYVEPGPRQGQRPADAARPRRGSSPPPSAAAARCATAPAPARRPRGGPLDLTSPHRPDSRSRRLLLRRRPEPGHRVHHRRHHPVRDRLHHHQPRARRDPRGRRSSRTRTTRSTSGSTSRSARP